MSYTQRPAITKHLGNIFKSGELDENQVYSILELTTQHGAIAGKTQVQQVKFYNLDAIISVGYRINSINASLFRKWANSVLKEYLLRGYAVNQRFERLEYRVAETEKQIDFIVKTSLPPHEGIFYNGQIFDAYKFVSDLIETVKKEILLIDNYIDASVLILLSKRKNSVKATVYTREISETLQPRLTETQCPICRNLYRGKAEHTRPFSCHRQRFVSYRRITQRFGQKTLCLLKNGNESGGIVAEYPMIA